MNRFLHFLRRIPRIPHRLYGDILTYLLPGYFWFLNLCGRAAITAPGGPVVSLTSYGTRIRTVHLAIESIGRGCVLPCRMILWLDDKTVFDRLPAALGRLVARGLEIKYGPDYGPHKKYYPYLQSQEVFVTPLVTADDDLLYPRFWLKKLVEAFQQFPEAVNCYRARVMGLNGNSIANYESWELAVSTEPSFRHFGTGCSGVIYPPALLRALKQEGTAFLDCCPKNDDIWLHVQALRAEYKVRQICETQFRQWEIPGTQSIALYHHNMIRSGNDQQIKATYTAEDIRKLTIA